MNYIISILPVFPIAALVAAVIYCAIYFIFKGKREKPSFGRILAEYVLVGWVVMFVYVTQIMGFGNGMGDGINLKPFSMFFVAFRYGSNNAGGIWQYFLNMLMFVPLGFLLPIVFPKSCRKYSRVLLVSFLATLATELIQIVTQRGTDIDDVIANTLGGLVGFALFLILHGIISKLRHKEIQVSHYTRSLIKGIVLCCVIAAVYVGIGFMDGSSKYGNLYYGHITPQSFVLNVQADETASERPVYKYRETTSYDELAQKLCSISGIQGEWVADGNSSSVHHSLYSDHDEAIFIDEFNRWSVYYEYGIDGTTERNDVGEDEALVIAQNELQKYGISSDEVAFEGFRYDFNDDAHHLTFIDSRRSDDTRVYGNISISVNKDGKVIVISDDRIFCGYVENAKCISPAESLDVAQDTGLSGGTAVTVVVNEITESWQFIPETGYLIPTWKITGFMEKACTNDGEPSSWQAEIDAVNP